MSGIALMARISELERTLKDLERRSQEILAAYTDLAARVRAVEEKRGPGRPRLVSNG